MIAGLHQRLNARLGQFVEDARCVIILRLIDIVYHVAQTHDTDHVQFVGAVNEPLDGVVHHIGAELHRVLGIGQQDDVVVVLVSQLILLVAAEVLHIVLRVGNQPILPLQRLLGDADFLQAALKEAVHRAAVFSPPGGAHTETTVVGVGKHTDHILFVKIAEGLAAIDVCADLFAIGDHDDVVPHAALVHGHGPSGRHPTLVICVAGCVLDFLAVGDGHGHATIIFVGTHAFRSRLRIFYLPGHQRHPPVSRSPVVGEIIHHLQRIPVSEFIFVDRGAIHGDKVRAVALSLLHRTVITVEDHAAAFAGHAVIREA